MKKVFLIIITLLCLTGCNKKINVNPINEFESSVNKTKSYKIVGTMELQNDEEIFEYELTVSYLKDSNYKVEMLNKTNNQEQIILKNEDGLYVITPALNKSFKFESTWPDNSSQAYILSSLLKDIKNDKNTSYVTKDDMYIIQCAVNYPNNSELSYQKIYLDKNYNLKKVEVYNDADLVKIKINLTDVDLKAGLNEDEFELKKYVNTSECEEENCSDEKTMSRIESAIYPLYTPANTYLSGSEVVNSDLDSRVILTFSGDKNFVIVEQNANAGIEHEIIPVYGEPIMLNDTIGALSTNSMYWTSNSVDYYLASDDLSIEEMVFVATSLTNARATIAEK